MHYITILGKERKRGTKTKLETKFLNVIYNKKFYIIYETIQNTKFLNCLIDDLVKDIRSILCTERPLC